MPFTNFPYGLTSFGVPVISSVGTYAGFGGIGTNTTPGVSNVYFVNSAESLASDTTDHGYSPVKPFKTLNFALTRTINNNGDLIFCGPGHLESVVAAAGLTFPTGTAAGVTVVFQGVDSERATIQFSALTTATMTVPASNVALYNPRFSCTLDAMAAPISVTGGLRLYNAKYVDASAVGSLIQIITTATGNLKIFGYEYVEPSTAGTQKTEAIRLVGGSSHYLYNAYIYGDFSTAPINNITTLVRGLNIFGCQIVSRNATPKPAVAILTTTTGVMSNTILQVASGSQFTSASNILSYDLASAGSLPGGTPTALTGTN